MLFKLTKTILAQSVFILFFITLQLLSKSANEPEHWFSLVTDSISYALNACLLALIGSQLQKLQRHNAPTKIFISLLIIHCLLQFFYVAASEFFHPGTTVSWLVPQATSELTACCLLSLLLIHIGNIFHIKFTLIITLTLIIAIAGFIDPNWNISIYLVICTLAGFYLHNWNDRSFRLQQILQRVLAPTLPLWFYLALITSGFIAIALPPQIHLSTTIFTLCILSCALSFLCLFFAASPIAYHVANWWLGWIGSITRLSIEPPSPVAHSSAELTRSYQIFTYSQYSLLRLLLITTAAIVIVELPFRNWEINVLIRWAENSSFFLAVSIAVIFSFYFIVRSFLMRTAAAAVTIVLIAIISAINYLKMQYLGMPFMPTDFYMADQALASLAFITSKTIALVIFGILMLLGVLALYLAVKFQGKIINKNVWIFLRGFLAVSAVFYFLKDPHKVFDASQVPNAWQMPGADQLYEYSGFFSSFIYKYIGGFNLEKPENYSSDSVHLLAQKNLISTQRPPIPTKQELPHVIAIQSEAFWDPGQLSAELFPEGSPGDLQSLCNTLVTSNEACATGYVGVPSFGGMTANTEFEFLTGIPMSFFPGVAVPFVHFIEKPTPSIVWRFRQGGYHTLGVHSNEGWFWNRDKAYPRLGFAEFKDGRYFSQAERNQFYVTDKAMNDLLVEEIQNAIRPQFIFSVTMANHGPFDDTRFQGYAPVLINWQAVPNLSDSQHQALNTYAIGVREARAALADLIGRFQQKDSPPIIIVFYGDHLPILGANFRIYHETGFKPETNNTPFQELYSTPYLVWSNRSLATTWPKHMPISLFGQYLAQAAGLGESGLEQTLQILGKTRFFNKPLREDLLNNKAQHFLSDHEKEVRTLYKHAFFDAFFNQSALDYFGLSRPLGSSAPE